MAMIHVPVRCEVVELNNGKHQIRVCINGRPSFDLIYDPETKTLVEVTDEDKNTAHA